MGVMFHSLTFETWWLSNAHLSDFLWEIEWVQIILIFFVGMLSVDLLFFRFCEKRQ